MTEKKKSGCWKAGESGSPTGKPPESGENVPEIIHVTHKTALAEGTVVDTWKGGERDGSLNLFVQHVFEFDIWQKHPDTDDLLSTLRESIRRTQDGDLSGLEAMLVAQASALQTMFIAMVMRSSKAQQTRNCETYLALALKAQAQSRATISALVDLKFPRQATFVKQANIAHGPQQVNNGAARAGAISHAEENRPEQNKLLEVNHGKPGGRLDTRAAQTAGRADTAVETVGKVHRTKKPRG